MQQLYTVKHESPRWSWVSLSHTHVFNTCGSSGGIVRVTVSLLYSWCVVKQAKGVRCDQSSDRGSVASMWSVNSSPSASLYTCWRWGRSGVGYLRCWTHDSLSLSSSLDNDGDSAEGGGDSRRHGRESDGRRRGVLMVGEGTGVWRLVCGGTKVTAGQSHIDSDRTTHALLSCWYVVRTLDLKRLWLAWIPCLLWRQQLLPA